LQNLAPTLIETQLPDTVVTQKILINLLFANYWHIKQDYIFNMNEYEGVDFDFTIY